MGLSDPFSTTFQGAYQATAGAGDDIDKIFQEKRAKDQQQQQRQQSIKTMKDMGWLKPDPATSKDYEDEIAKKTGTKVMLKGDIANPENKQVLDAIVQHFGITPPQPKKYSLDVDAMAKAGADVNFTTGELSSKPSQKSEMDMYYKQQRLQLAQDAAKNKKNTEQDRIEQQAIQGIRSVRGDSPMANVENQRNSTILAYRTLSDAEKAGRLPTQFEYMDLLGQLWKARTGGVPPEQIVNELNTPNIESNLKKLYTYITGDPSVGVGTPKIISALKDFVANSGEQLDTMEDSYMKDHLIKPTGLEDSRWENLKNLHRGQSFKDARKELDERGSKNVLSTPAGQAIQAGQQGGGQGLPSQSQAPKGAKGWSKSQNKWVF